MDEAAFRAMLAWDLLSHCTKPLAPSDHLIVGGIRQSGDRPVFDQARKGEDGSDFALPPESHAARRVEAYKRAMQDGLEASDGGMLLVALQPDDEGQSTGTSTGVMPDERN